MLEDDVQVQGSDAADNFRADLDGACLRFGGCPRGDGDGCDGRADVIAEFLPIVDEILAIFGSVAGRSVPRKLDRIGTTRNSIFPGAANMKIYVGTDVESVELHGGRIGKAQAEEGIEHSKGLDGLQGIKIVALFLVGEIQAGADHRNTMNAAGFEQPFFRHVAEVLADQEIGPKIGVERNAALLEKLEA